MWFNSSVHPGYKLVKVYLHMYLHVLHMYIWICTHKRFENAALSIFVQYMEISQREKYLYLSSRLNILAKLG